MPQQLPGCKERSRVNKLWFLGQIWLTNFLNGLSNLELCSDFQTWPGPERACTESVWFCVYVCAHSGDQSALAEDSWALPQLAWAEHPQVAAHHFPVLAPLVAVQGSGWAGVTSSPALWTVTHSTAGRRKFIFSSDLFYTLLYAPVSHAAFHYPVQTFLSIKLALIKTKITILYWRIPIIAVSPDSEDSLASTGLRRNGLSFLLLG